MTKRRTNRLLYAGYFFLMAALFATCKDSPSKSGEESDDFNQAVSQLSGFNQPDELDEPEVLSQTEP